MHAATVATTFAAVFLAELPDKTMLATVVLTTRLRRPTAVWAGAALALSTQVAIAVTAGQLLRLLPDRPLRLVVAGVFAAGALLLWRHGQGRHDEDGDDHRLAAGQAGALRWRTAAATAFGIVFIAEWGDLTQLATAGLASTRPPLSVAVGAAAALVTVSSIGVLAGRALVRVLPERLLHRAAAGVFAVLAVAFVVAAVRAG